MAMILGPIMATSALAGATPALASPATTVLVAGKQMSLSGVDWSSPDSVEQFLLRVQAVQHSTNIDFLATAPAYVQAAVVRTETRPSATTHTTGFTSLSRAQMTALGGLAATATSCGWGWMVASYRPGYITYTYIRLQTLFCWNGYAVFSGQQAVDAWGGWGWRDMGTVNQYLIGWPSPTAYNSFFERHFQFGWGPFSANNHPWIRHIVTGQGWVYTSWSDS